MAPGLGYAPLGFNGDTESYFSGEEPQAASGIDYSPLDFNGDTGSYFSGEDVEPLGDATPTGESYMLIDNWGGTWYDAEKSPSNTEDDLLCWAATASNVLAWTGWGDVDGMTTADDNFAYYQDHWTDAGSLMRFGWEWWLDGTNSSQGWSGWSQVDVVGGGFYPGDAYADYAHIASSPANSMATIDSYLNSGYGVGIGIYGPGGHAISVWGFNYTEGNPSDYQGIWVTDSDDSKYIEDAPDQLHYYEVENSGGSWFLQDYYGSDSWYIDVVAGLEQSPYAAPAPEPITNEIHGTVWDDADEDGQQDVGENGLGSQLVFIDANANGTFDSGTVTAAATDTPLAIPDAGTGTSTITVAGAGAYVEDVNVTLDITHTWDSDLDVFLISADGTRVELFTDIGGSGTGFSGTTLDDDAASGIAQGTAPFSGTFRPEGSLAALDGENANGTWTLEITDDEAFFVGMLNSWSLEITAGEVSATTAADGSYELIGVADGTHGVYSQTPAGWTQTAPQAGCFSVAVQGGQTVANKDFGLKAPPAATDFGTLDFSEVAGLNLGGGDYWYTFQATRGGYLSAEAVFVGSGAQMTLYDGAFSELATSAPSVDGQRIDWDASAGDTFYLAVSGDNADVDLRVANLVSLNGNSVTVYGTNGNDRFDFAVAPNYQVTINDVHYQFSSATVSSISFDALAGDDDTAVLIGSTGKDTLTSHPSTATLSGAGYSLLVENTRDIIVDGNGGADLAKMYDSAGKDTFIGTSTYAELFNDDAYCRVNNFRYVHAYSSGGTDSAQLYDSAGNDRFEATPEQAVMRDNASSTFYVRAKGFRFARGYADNGGTDIAMLYDSAGDDTFLAGPTQSLMYADNYYLKASDFEYANGLATAGGNDTATLSDSADNDVLKATPQQAILSSASLYLRAKGFDAVTVSAGAGGTDVAKLYDSAGDDTFSATPTQATISGAGFSIQADNFRYVHAMATGGGNDVAHLYDSVGADIFKSNQKSSALLGAAFYNRVKLFDEIYAHSDVGGNDKAYLYDSTGDDHFEAAGGSAEMTSSLQSVSALNFTKVKAFSANGGTNTKHTEATDFLLYTYGPWQDV